MKPIRWWIIAYFVALFCLAWIICVHADDGGVVYLDFSEYNCFVYDEKEFDKVEDLLEYIVLKRMTQQNDKFITYRDCKTGKEHKIPKWRFLW